MLQGSSGAEASARPGSSGNALGLRLLSFGALLVAEYLLISLLFDARALHGRGGIAGALGYLGDAATIALVVAAAVLALMGPQLRAAVTSLPPLQRSGRGLVLGLLAHALAYGAFLGSTAVVFGSPGGSDPAPGWMVVWGFAGATVAATWLPLALPWPALRVLLPRLTMAVSIGGGAGVLAWLAGQVSASVWSSLGPLTLYAVAWLLHLVVDPVFVDAEDLLIGTLHFQALIAPECSGFEGIGLIVTFLGGYMAVDRGSLRFPHVLALLPVAVITVWCANALRIALLILVGSYVSPAIALGGFHSKAGWLFFCAIALSFVALTRRSRYFAAEGATEASHPGQAEDTVNVAAPYLMPLLALLAAALVTGLFTVDFDLLYPVRMVAVGVVLWAYRAHYRQLELRLHWDSVAIGAGVFALWVVLAQGGDGQAVGQLQLGLSELAPAAAVVWLAFRVLGMSIVVPIVEELAFRGYLLRRLISADFDTADARAFAPWAWVLSATAFGVLHGDDWFAGVLAGLAYALAQQRRGRVTDAMIAHAVTNFLLCITGWATGDLRWWT